MSREYEPMYHPDHPGWFLLFGLEYKIVPIWKGSTYTCVVFRDGQLKSQFPGGQEKGNPWVSKQTRLPTEADANMRGDVVWGSTNNGVPDWIGSHRTRDSQTTHWMPLVFHKE